MSYPTFPTADCRVKSPYEFTKGKRENGRFDMILQLRGDLLMGTPVVQELVNEQPVANGTAGTTLDIGTPTRNSAPYTSEQGVFVDVSQAVIVPIEVLKGKRGGVVVRVTCDTTNADRNVMMEFEFETRD